MNTLEFSRRVNRGIEECSKGIASEANERDRVYMSGIKAGLEAAHKIFNEVNHGAADETSPLRRCNGYGERKGICQNKVPKKFLVLNCDDCEKIRKITSNKPVYNQCTHEIEEEIFVIPFPD